MKFTHKNTGTCSTSVTFDIEDGRIRNIQFTGGCNGNLKAVAKLAEGRDAKEVAAILRGNTCGPRATSCADQLAQAIEEAIAG